MNNKGVDQTARMRRLICAFVVRMQLCQVFLLRGPYNDQLCLQQLKIYVVYSFYFHLKINVYVTGLNSLMNLDKLGHIDDKNIRLLNNSFENSIFER